MCILMAVESLDSLMQEILDYVPEQEIEIPSFKPDRNFYYSSVFECVQAITEQNQSIQTVFLRVYPDNIGDHPSDEYDVPLTRDEILRGSNQIQDHLTRHKIELNSNENVALNSKVLINRFAR